VPANVTTAPVCSFWRSIVLLGGAEIFERTILLQDLTADEIEAYAVTMQVVLPPPPAAVVFVLVSFAVDVTIVVGLLVVPALVVVGAAFTIMSYVYAEYRFRQEVSLPGSS
jgi:hypothetical protein